MVFSCSQAQPTLVVVRLIEVRLMTGGFCQLYEANSVRFRPHLATLNGVRPTDSHLKSGRIPLRSHCRNGAKVSLWGFVGILITPELLYYPIL